MSDYHGSFNDGSSANRHDVSVRIDLSGLAISGDGLAQPVVWPFEELEAIDDIAKQVPFRIGCRSWPDARLTLNDQRLLADFRIHAPQLFGPPVSRRLRNVVLSIAGAGLLGASIWFGLPLASRWVASVVPIEWEVALADQFADELVKEFASMTNDEPRVCDNPDGLKALDGLIAELADAGGSPYDFNVQVIDGGLNNAFALPGGRIFIFRGLLEFAQSPDQLAAVVAHEMGHVTLQHGTTAIVQGLGISFVFSVLLGDMGGGIVAAAGEILLRMSYSREAEAEADRSAIALLQKADLKVVGLSNFFERLAEEDGDLPAALQMLSTHPSSEQRAQLTKGLEDTGRPALSDKEWQAIRDICKQ
ncbi:M48 family metallopeptidase [Denitrobaculum tricleocarpae]|uniref:M48 family metallopeptidase n=1 Tax=Denitrobaculum tricleocarpae TaxID=2591009 RepID=A0A545TQW7_9PROT|nr:M48 family metallopeptidase [Denitrobaculum tricleocarpae]TQV79608.1 M48 family metallopeptidase [Denitrobaculum tricleocarpae]